MSILQSLLYTPSLLHLPSCCILEAHTRSRGLTAGPRMRWRTSTSESSTDVELYVVLAATPNLIGEPNASMLLRWWRPQYVVLYWSEDSPHGGGDPIGPHRTLT